MTLFTARLPSGASVGSCNISSERQEAGLMALRSAASRSSLYPNIKNGDVATEDKLQTRNVFTLKRNFLKKTVNTIVVFVLYSRQKANLFFSVGPEPVF